ncbi:hypothetical protein IJS77_01030 [bacterium]|nr:hypothetical protein [bacterium]
MKISFKSVILYKYPNSKMRDIVKDLESSSPNRSSKYWTSVSVDREKDSSDLLVLTGSDLKFAVRNKKDNQSVQDYILANLDRYIKKAEVFDTRIHKGI